MDITAAVVRSFDHPPRYESLGLPAPADEDEVALDVLAVGLHPRVRTGASGRHSPASCRWSPAWTASDGSRTAAWSTSWPTTS